MNDREILAACLRWHTTHERRMAASSRLYEHKKAEKQRTGYFSSAYDLSVEVTEAKRLERAALRALAKVCASVRTNQQGVTDVIEMLPMLTHSKPFSPTAHSPNF
jgi:hypothetical protein